MSLPPPPPSRSPKATPPPPPPSARKGPVKTFSIKPWTDEGQGHKIVLYGASGIGKTTLATMAPDPVFVGIDDGGRKIRNPKTGEPVNAVEGVVTFDDLRDAIRQPGLIHGGQTLVVDNITQAQKLAEAYTFGRVKVGNTTPQSLEDYGYGKGYRFLCETMRLLLTDLEVLMRQGVHILLIAQDAPHRVPNLEGTDYLRAGPELDVHGVPNVLGEYHQWADHVFRINFPPALVRVDSVKATKGKATGNGSQRVYTAGDLHFMAKNRCNGTIPAEVSFATPDDDSLWQALFQGVLLQETV